MTTGKKAAKIAGKKLSSSNTHKQEKTIAASDLAQRAHKKSPTKKK